MKMSESIESDGAVAGTTRVVRHSFLKGAVIATAVYLGTTVCRLSAQQVGPGTTVDPYVLPSMAGVETTSMLTVGDLPADNGYRMVGIPDGLGAFRRGDNFALLMNHELGNFGDCPRPRFHRSVCLALDHRSQHSRNVEGRRPYAVAE